MKDVLGQALADYQHHSFTGKLWVHRMDPVPAHVPGESPGNTPAGALPAGKKSWWRIGRNPDRVALKEEMPVNIYFRNMDEMPELEWVALQECRGKILDIGAGAGSHSLALQQMGLDVTALDISPLAVAVIKKRGVNQVVCQDFFKLAMPTGASRVTGGQEANPSVPPETGDGYDTLLLMMNGIGVAGTLEGLRAFLRKARALLRPGGRLLFDSTDIAYLYGGNPPKTPDYYGELFYQYEYREKRSDWFKWLFIDRKTLTEIAAEEGWQTRVIAEDDFDQYLVKCSR